MIKRMQIHPKLDKLPSEDAEAVEDVEAAVEAVEDAEVAGVEDAEAAAAACRGALAAFARFDVVSSKDGPRTRAFPGPAIGKFVLLTDTHLILEPNLYWRARRECRADFRHA